MLPGTARPLLLLLLFKVFAVFCLLVLCAAAAAHTGVEAQASVHRCFVIAAYRWTKPAVPDPAAVRAALPCAALP